MLCSNWFLFNPKITCKMVTWASALKKSLLTLVDATIVPPISTECPLKDYTNFFSSCYRLYLDPKTFDEAQKTCQKDSAIDSFLATTDVGYENALLEFLIYRQGAGASSVWIGLQKDTVSNFATFSNIILLLELFRFRPLRETIADETTIVLEVVLFHLITACKHISLLSDCPCSVV